MSLLKIHEVKSITHTALPLMATFLAQKGMQLIDALMMGWLGADALAAGALGATIYMIVVFCLGTLSSVGIFIVRARGANDVAEIETSLQQGVVLAIFLAIPCVLIMWYAPLFLLYVGQNPAIVANTTLFLHALVWGIPGFLLFFVLREFVSAFALARMVMLITISSLPLTAIANYILMYGKLGLPRLGIAGIGYASAGIMWLMLITLFFYARKQILLKKYIAALISFKINFPKLRDMFYLGFPSGAMLLLDVGMFALGTLMMGHFGVAALAAHQIALQCGTVAYSGIYALSIATSLQVSHAVGAKDFAQAKRYISLGFVMALIAAALASLVFIFAPELLARLFLQPSVTDYRHVIKLATSFLLVAAIFQFADALQASANGALRGLKDTFVPMLLIVVCYWVVGVGGSYYFAFHTSLGAIGIWWGLALGLGSSGIVLWWRLFRLLKFGKNML